MDTKEDNDMPRFITRIIRGSENEIIATIKYIYYNNQWSAICCYNYKTYKIENIFRRQNPSFEQFIYMLRIYRRIILKNTDSIVIHWILPNNKYFHIKLCEEIISNNTLKNKFNKAHKPIQFS
jgi:hypothetical protein